MVTFLTWVSGKTSCFAAATAHQRACHTFRSTRRWSAIRNPSLIQQILMSFAWIDRSQQLGCSSRRCQFLCLLMHLLTRWLAWSHTIRRQVNAVKAALLPRLLVLSFGCRFMHDSLEYVLDGLRSILRCLTALAELLNKLLEGEVATADPDHDCLVFDLHDYAFVPEPVDALCFSLEILAQQE